jgi:uncharacterized membrane protein YdjX (TVP38/TMEM64 family)
MVSLDRLKRYSFGSVIGSLPLMFGSYLMYDRIFLDLSHHVRILRWGDCLVWTVVFVANVQSQVTSHL